MATMILKLVSLIQERGGQKRKSVRNVSAYNPFK